MNLNLWNQLTLEEKLSLEQRYHFGITDQAIKDVIRLRGATYTTTPERLIACIKEAQEHLTWLQSRAKATGSKAFDQAIACQMTRIDDLDRKLAALTAAQVTQAAE